MHIASHPASPPQASRSAAASASSRQSSSPSRVSSKMAFSHSQTPSGASSSASPSRTPGAPSNGSAQSSSSASQSSSSSSLQREPDYFATEPQRSNSQQSMKLNMPSRFGSSASNIIPPTPGPSDIGPDHPWARAFQPGGSSFNGGHPFFGGDENSSVPQTPGGVVPPTPSANDSPKDQSSSSPFGNLRLSSLLGGKGSRKPSVPGTLAKSKSPPSAATYVASPSATPGASSPSARKSPSFTSASMVAAHSSSSLPIPPKNNVASLDKDLSRFSALKAEELTRLVNDGSTAAPASPSGSILLIDIRPSTAYSASHIKGSINVCAPSTLLRRPNVTVQRIEDEMLQSKEDGELFTRWKTGPRRSSESQAKPDGWRAGAKGIDRIVVLDVDTYHVDDVGRSATGGGGPCLVGMLRKFDQAGFDGQLCWLIGGFKAFSKIADPALLRSKDTGSKGSTPGRKSMPSLKLPVFASNSNSHDTSEQGGQWGSSLPQAAFGQGTTTEGQRGAVQSASEPKLQLGTRGLSGGSSTACNPFFDNIRQNRELQHGVTDKIPLDLPDLSQFDLSVLPTFLQQVADMPTQQRTDQLAHDFFEIEKAEQQRLMSTMRQHAADSRLDPRQAAKSDEKAEGEGPMQLSSPYCRAAGSSCRSLSDAKFPFSIAAAMEKGNENRYNNIWTYEHSRVKVDERSDNSSDYLNGSFVQPLRQYGSQRQYIATQAPLPSTFETFWNAVWQHGSRTIAMLTREYESGRVQSHDYWSQPQYGSSIGLKLLEEVKLNARGSPCPEQAKTADDAGGAGFFAEVTKVAENPAVTPVIIRRKILLTNLKVDASLPQNAPREITHLQYIGWPDYSIPADPEALLTFIDLASEAQSDAENALVRPSGSPSSTSTAGPLVLHCSAGVGRTGTYAVIDSVLDVLRRERRRNRGLPLLSTWDNGLATPRGECGPRFNAPDADVLNDVEMSPAPQADAASSHPAQSTPLYSNSPTPAAINLSANSFQWPSRPEGDLGGSPSPAPGTPGTRRSLKRELSPSADLMLSGAGRQSGSVGPRGDLDASNLGIPQANNEYRSRRSSSVASPPPLDRKISDGSTGSSSSDSPIDPSEQTQTTHFSQEPSAAAASSSSSSFMPLSPKSTSSGIRGRRGSAFDNIFAANGGQDAREVSTPSASGAAFGWSSLGIRQPTEMDTPSRAMDGMNLGLATPPCGGGPSGSSTPSSGQSALRRGSLVAQAAAAAAARKGVNDAPSSLPLANDDAAPPAKRSSLSRSSPRANPPTRGSALAAPSSNSPTESASASTLSSSSTSTSSSALSPATSPPRSSEEGLVPDSSKMDTVGDRDLIRHATNVAREQRMSSVQTQRQYVFCYLAVLKGVLREAKRERGSDVSAAAVGGS